MYRFFVLYYIYSNYSSFFYFHSLCLTKIYIIRVLLIESHSHTQQKQKLSILNDKCFYFMQK